MPRRQISNIIAGRGLVSATCDMTVRAACLLMAENHVGALAVVETGRIVGIFTERDALNKVLAGGLDPDATTLEAVMVANPQTIEADRPLAHALHMMADGGFRHVPVVDAHGAPLGKNASELLSTPLKAYVLLGIEPEFDLRVAKRSKARSATERYPSQSVPGSRRIRRILALPFTSADRSADGRS